MFTAALPFTDPTFPGTFTVCPVGNLVPPMYMYTVIEPAVDPVFVRVLLSVTVVGKDVTLVGDTVVVPSVILAGVVTVTGVTEQTCAISIHSKLYRV